MISFIPICRIDGRLCWYWWYQLSLACIWAVSIKREQHEISMISTRAQRNTCNIYACFYGQGPSLQFQVPICPVSYTICQQWWTAFWECVSWLEQLGFKVMGLCCNGLAVNRRLFSLNSDYQLPYKVVNPFLEDMRYWSSSPDKDS